MFMFRYEFVTFNRELLYAKLTLMILIEKKVKMSAEYRK